jgi:hypothetical protein
MRAARTALRGVLLAGALCACGGGSERSDVDARIDALFGDGPFGTLNRDTARRLLEVAPADDGPFYMVNLIRHRERAEYPDGRPTDLTGAEADAIYGAHVLPILLSIGAQPIYVGDVEVRLIDRDGAGWDQVTVVLYPSRAQLAAMLARDDFQAAAEHKIAGVERSTILVTDLASPLLPEELRRVDLAALPFPPTPADPPVTVVHLIAFNGVAQFADGRETDLTGREALELYEQARTPQAFPLGVRPGIRLAVEGELIGDGRPWEEVRINNFPSRAAFTHLISAESLDQAGIENREAALADTYALLVAPVINQVGYLD